MAVDLPAPSGPVRMLHGTRVVSAAISLECYASMASFGWLRTHHTCCYGFMHRWRSFGLVALTPLLVLLRVYCCDLRQQQCRNGIADCMTNANRLLGAFVLPCCSLLC